MRERGINSCGGESKRQRAFPRQSCTIRQAGSSNEVITTETTTAQIVHSLICEISFQLNSLDPTVIQSYKAIVDETTNQGSGGEAVNMCLERVCRET
jgi:hypothetical protein